MRTYGVGGTRFCASAVPEGKCVPTAWEGAPPCHAVALAKADVRVRCARGKMRANGVGLAELRGTEPAPLRVLLFIQIPMSSEKFFKRNAIVWHFAVLIAQKLLCIVVSSLGGSF